MSFPGLYNIVKETEEDWSASSSSVLTSSSEETDDSDWCDDLEEIKIELSTEEMSISSKGTAGWLHKHHILKSKRKHAEAKSISASDKETVKENPKGRQTTKAESTLEGTSVSANRKETVKAKLKRKNSSNRSLSSNIKVDHKAEDHQYTAPRSWSTFFNRGATNAVAPNARYSSDVENEDANNKEIEDDRSATSSPVSTSSSEETDGSDWSDDLEKVKIELSTEEMSTSSKGTVGWFYKHHILKSKRKHAEAKGISTSNKENAKEKPTRKHDAKSQSTLEGKSFSADRKETAKAKLKSNNSSNRSLSSILKDDHKAKDHHYAAKTTRINGGAATSVELKDIFSSGVENEVFLICSEPPPQNRCFKVVPKNHGRRHHHATRSLCCEVVDDIFDSTYFLQCLGEDVKEESLKFLPWQSGNDEKNNISFIEASTSKSEDHEFYLSRSATAASF